MVTQQSQIKVNLPVQLKYFLELKAGKFGMPMAGYIKQLYSPGCFQTRISRFFASEKTEKHTNKYKRKKKGKLITKFKKMSKTLDFSLPHR